MTVLELVPHITFWLTVAVLAIAVGRHIVHTLLEGHRR